MLKKTNNRQLIYSLDNECFEKPYSIKTILELSPSHHFFLIIDNEIIVGFIIINQIQTECELIKIGILKKYRQQGIAYNALKEMMNLLSFEKIFLEVDEKNTNAIKLYFKLNFKPIGYRKNYYQNGNNALILEYNKQ